MMMKRVSLILFLSLFVFVPSLLIAQEEEEEEQPGQSYEDLLFKEVEVENPVYYPVLSVGTGMLNYFGELSDDKKGFGTSPPLKINLYHFLDNQQNFRVNIFGLSGNLNGSFHTLPEEEELIDRYKGITNFQTEMLALGLNLEYGFGHFYDQRPRFRPFLAMGGEVLIYNPKSDYMKNGSPYDWNEEQIILRDYNYDYNLRNTNVFNVNDFNQNTAALTLDIGFDFAFSNRVAVRVGTSGHYTFTDLIDGIPHKDGRGSVIGDKFPDILSFTYVTFGWDPFSESETQTVERLLADISEDFDYTAIADTDRDGIIDLHDECPDNPQGVAIDTTTGCPVDSDNDGVSDYKDKENYSSEGAIVNDQGVEMTEDRVLSSMNYNLMAVDRNDAYMIPVTTDFSSKYSNVEGKLEIPDKFKSVDKDNDGDISYDELLQAIDNFFNDRSDFNANEIYELNDFFFAQ
ncbi:MAG: hypothetical protein K9H65_03230 [Bacteroidales bacterium]|nr:hypothetical protein [Bacteroidales bacterium]